jgi:hypothetical protein
VKSFFIQGYHANNIVDPKVKTQTQQFKLIFCAAFDHLRMRKQQLVAFILVAHETSIARDTDKPRNTARLRHNHASASVGS